MADRVVGRFAPSPTGPLHIGSLVAAVGSWLFARHSGGRWLVRMEDLDTPRVRPGSADDILGALLRYGLEWDGEIVWQSQRHPLYHDALDRLRRKGLAYDCGCSRAELQRLASAPLTGDADAAGVYPGRCRNGLPDGAVARAVRFRAPEKLIAFDDLVRGRIDSNVARDTGDFVILRADGVWAYQLAVVVDDAEQGVTQVVRGGDLVDSTARQVALQEALELPTPGYAHLPLVVNADGSKLGKRDGALPLPLLDEERVRRTLAAALNVNGCGKVEAASPKRMLEEGLATFSVERLRRMSTVVRLDSSPGVV